MVDLFLAKALSGKGSLEMSNKIIGEKMEKMEKRHDWGYWYIHELQVERFNNLMRENKLDLQNIFDAQHSICKSLISYFLITFSDWTFYVLFSFKTQNIQCEDRSLSDFIKLLDSKKLLDYLDKSGHPDSASIKMHYLLMYYVDNEFTEENFFELKSCLIKNIKSFSKMDIIGFWNRIVNLAIVKLVPYNHKFNKEIFKLNDFCYKLKIYPDSSLENFIISLLRNIVIIAIIVEEFEWAENFLNEYINYIDDNRRENEMNYNMGMLKFNHKEYEESLKYLSRLNFSDIYENLNIRFYLLMNHIELKHYDSAASIINSIKQFYKSSKEIPEFAGSLIKDSLKYFSEIIKCEESKTKLDYSIYKEASAPKRYYHKKYIKDKMKELV